MSFDNLSKGAGLEPKSASGKPKEGMGRGINEPSRGSQAPWDKLRPVEPKPGEPKPPSRLGRFFRRALRWAVGLLVIFALGVGATWFLRVQPMQGQIDDLKDQRQAAEITVSGLESQIMELMLLQDENDSLKAQLLDTQLHVDLMRVLVDVTSSELALANDDLITAKASLTGTDARLASLQETLQGDDQETIEGMRTRLALVLEELEADDFAAMSDLDVLKSNLVALERSLFGP